jgi:putative protease
MTVMIRNPPHPRLPELLAPAGSPEAFHAAMAAGADAIYLSGKRFGARKYAANFSDTEIEEAVRYAHSHGIRVYVTVNTLIHDRELAGVMDYLVWLYTIGVDAVLVQDTGIAALAREYLPGLPLHASTQLTIHTSGGVRWAHEQGFSRVVLARELSLEEVCRIAEDTKDTGVGLEVFAHGALCYSYSGQCLLSSVIGGRSGNRGMCAQPCRKAYTLVRGETDEYGRPGRLSPVPQKNRYLLSPKDLCTYSHLPELVLSPISSLKIEGRMKSPEYVAIVVSTYRQALDAIAAGTWKESPEAIRDLLLAFNRGFTGGYLFGDRYEKLMGRDAPDNRGLLVGMVEQYDRTASVAKIRSVIPVLPVTGDGMLITGPGKPDHDRGFALNSPPRKTGNGFTLVLPGPVTTGDSVYITSSRDLNAKVRRIIAKPDPGYLRLLPVCLDVTVLPDGSFQIVGKILRREGASLPVSFHSRQRMEPARTHPLTCEHLEQQLKKTGKTPFTVRHIQLHYDGNMFAPVAVLNEVRREFFQMAGEQLEAASRPLPENVDHVRQRLRTMPLLSQVVIPERPDAGSARFRLSVYTGSLEGVRKAAESGADTICFEPFLPSGRHLCTEREPGSPLRFRILAAMDACRDAGVNLIWKLPRIAHDSLLDALIPEIVFLHGNGLKGCMVENQGIAHALLSAVPSLPLYGSIGLNIFNQAAVTHAGISYNLLTLSPELSCEEIRILTGLATTHGNAPVFSLIVQGSSEAMITEDCLSRLVLPCRRNETGDEGELLPGFLGLKDETGRVFPLITDGDCRTHISNASELCLIDLLPAIRDAGITDIAIDARHRTPSYTGKMAALYREAVEITCNKTGGSCKAALNRLKEQVKEVAIGGITTGHFIRGLRE